MNLASALPTASEKTARAAPTELEGQLFGAVFSAQPVQTDVKVVLPQTTEAAVDPAQLPPRAAPQTPALLNGGGPQTAVAPPSDPQRAVLTSETLPWRAEPAPSASGPKTSPLGPAGLIPAQPMREATSSFAPKSLGGSSAQHANVNAGQLTLASQASDGLGGSLLTDPSASDGSMEAIRRPDRALPAAASSPQTLQQFRILTDTQPAAITPGEAVSGATVLKPRGSLAPAAAGLPTAPTSPEQPPVLAQIRAAIEARDGAARIELRLDPPELGRVQVEFEMRPNGQLRAVITANEADTLDLFRRHGESLEQDLRDQGFSDLSFEWRGRGDGANEPAAQNTGSVLLAADAVTPTDRTSPDGGRYILNLKL